jgi:hypothetical protein
MRKQLFLLVCTLLCPVLAGAQGRHMSYRAERPDDPGWLGIGFGSGSMESPDTAPSAGLNAFTFSLDAGVHINPQWGLGIEYGLIAPHGGCGGHHCTPAYSDFAPDFSHWFLLVEQRPGNGGLRLRGGVGVSSMCYRYYRARDSQWEKFWDSVFFGDDDDADQNRISWHCKSLQALGASASVGYQWSLPHSPGSIGLQLRGEAANFAASSTAGTSAFHHRAVSLQIQLKIKD